MLFLLPFTILAQEEDSKELVIEKYRYSTYNFIQVDIDDNQKKTIVFDAILNQITGSGFNVIGTSDIYSIETEGSNLSEKGINYAREAEAQTAIIVNVILQNNDGLEMILIQSRVYRISDGKMIASLNKRTFIDYTLVKTVDRIAEKLHEKAYNVLFYSEEENMTQEQKTLLKAIPCTITVYCNQDGASVYLSDTDLMGTISGGELILPFHPLALNQELKVTVQHEGYYDQEEVIVLDQGEIGVKIGELYKAAIAALDFYYTPPSFIGAGIGVRFYPIKDDLFIELKSYFFGSGLFDDTRNVMFHNELTLKVGYYPVLKGNRKLRFNINTGIGMLNSIVMDSTTSEETATTYFDWYISMVEVAIELNLPKVSLYLSPEVRYYNPGNPGEKALLPSGMLDSSKGSDFPVIVNMGVIWKF